MRGHRGKYPFYDKGMIFNFEIVIIPHFLMGCCLLTLLWCIHFIPFRMCMSLLNLYLSVRLSVSLFLSLSLSGVVLADQGYAVDTRYFKVRKRAKIRNRNNQVPHLTQDTNGKVTNSQLDITNESQEASPFPAGDLKATKNRRAQKYNRHTT